MSKYLAERTDGIFPSKIRQILGKVSQLKAEGVEVTDFSIGRPDFDTPRHIKEATIKALNDGMVHYTPSQGTRSFREAVCYRFDQDYGLKIEPEEVIATIGASEAINVALQSILNPGDEVLAPEPMYVYYQGWVFLAGGMLRTFKPQKDFLPTAAEIEENITEKTKVLLLTYPHNPTGQVIDRANIEKIAQVAVKNDLIVIADDIYNRILYDNEDYASIAKMPGMLDRTVIIGSFSKTYAMDGWRIGYLVVPRELQPGMAKIHQHIISCPNTFVQVGAEAALKGPQDCVDEMIAEFDRRRQLIMSWLDDMGMPYIRPKGAFYIFPSIEKYGMNSRDFADYLLNKARVAVVPGYAFGEAGEGHIRLSFSVSYEDIEKGVERMKGVL